MLVSHVLVPPAMEALLGSPTNRIQGFLAAGHVCTVMGFEEYAPLAERYRVPIVVTGFEPLDILHGIYCCVRQLESGRAEVENAYARSVRRDGNRPAQEVMREVFRVMPRKWRGIGEIPRSGLGLAEAYRDFDAEERFGAAGPGRAESRECISGLILQGVKKPPECPAFGTRCTPEHPLGRDDGVLGGRLRGLLSLSPRRPHRGGVVRAMPDGEDFAPVCPLPAPGGELVQLAHGGGGRAMARLIERLFLPSFDNPALSARHDGAALDLAGRARLHDRFLRRASRCSSPAATSAGSRSTARSTTSPCAAPARFISASGCIIEDGLAMAILERVAASMREAAAAVGALIVTGDTKVVERGKADRLYVNTAGIGRIEAALPIAPARVRPGDAVLLSGDLGRHGIAVMAAREGLGFESAIESDCAPLVEPVLALIEAGVEVRCLRDLTRGGLASALVEIAESGALGIELEEPAIAVRDDVRSACELLGFDPIYVANEGRFVAFVAPDEADRALAILKRHEVSRGAAAIGRVSAGPPGRVSMRGAIGGTRVVDMLSGEQLPRIC